MTKLHIDVSPLLASSVTLQNEANAISFAEINEFLSTIKTPSRTTYFFFVMHTCYNFLSFYLNFAPMLCSSLHSLTHSPHPRGHSFLTYSVPFPLSQSLSLSFSLSNNFDLSLLLPSILTNELILRALLYPESH